MKTGIAVADAMTTKPVTCARSLSLRDAAKLMKKHSVGSLLVMENDRLIGIMTEKDLVHKAIATGMSLDAPLSGIMSTEVVSIAPNVDIFDAIKLLNEHGFRHLPVMEKGKLVGYITLRTILKIEPQLIDLFTERFELRGIRPESRVLEIFDELQEGLCESCGNYSSSLRDDDGQSVCPNCRRH
jgi:signal-transduction protein with cAMP-binding, CBS, and nucleotidyltransferase domain